MNGTSKNTLVILGLLFFPFCIYFTTLGNPFVYDDLILVQGNRNLDDVTNARKLFTGEYFTVSGERGYRPVATALSFLDVAIGGRKPLVFRATSILIHLLNGTLVFLIVFALTRRRPLSALTALFFLLHPIQTEAVNGITFVEDPLSALFFFSALYVYLRHREGGKAWFRLPLSIALYVLAVFSKESTIMLPFVIILVEFLFGEERIGSILCKRRATAVGFAAATAFFIAIRFVVVVNPHAGAAPQYPGGNLLNALPLSAAAFAKYVKLFFYPAGLSIEHCFTIGNSYYYLYVVTGVAVILAAFAAGMLARRSDKAVSFGAFFFLLNLFPISGIVPFGAVMAERYLYLPSFGLCLMTVALLMPRSDGGAAAGRSEGWNVIFVLCFILIYSLFTLQRNMVWRDELRLWKSAVRECPNSSRVQTSYGRELIESGRGRPAIEAAAAHLETAVKLDPNHYEALLALGTAYWRLGDTESAEAVYARAYKVHPTNDVRYNLALLLNAENKPGKALPLLMEIVETQPDWAAARYLLGNTYLRLRKPDEAKREYLKTLTLKPDYIEAKGNLGVAFMQLNDLDKAETIFREIINEHPHNKYAAQNLDRVLALKKTNGLGR